MTYCVAMALDRGLLFASDSRTNAGVDHVSTFSKMTVFETPGERVLVLLNSGNLATTQAVVSTLRKSVGTDAPNLMWATDATQVATVRDGKVWFFAVAEHWNAEALGWHVSKRGTRHEALQAMSMAVRQQSGLSAV